MRIAMSNSNGVIMSIADAKRRIALEAMSLDTDPSPARAKAVTTKVVDDVIDTLTSDGRTEEQKFNVLVRLGKFAKSSAYRAALVAAIAARETAFTAALVASMTGGVAISALKTYHLATHEVWKTRENVKRVVMTHAVLITMSAFVAFASYIKLVKRTLRFIKKVTWNWL
jgi:hypothetical protein